MSGLSIGILTWNLAGQVFIAFTFQSWKEKGNQYFDHSSTLSELFNNYSPKAKLIFLNNPRDEVEGIIQQY